MDMSRSNLLEPCVSAQRLGVALKEVLGTGRVLLRASSELLDNQGVDEMVTWRAHERAEATAGEPYVEKGGRQLERGVGGV